MIQKYLLNSIDATDKINTIIHKTYKNPKDKYWSYKNSL